MPKVVLSGKASSPSTFSPDCVFHLPEAHLHPLCQRSLRAFCHNKKPRTDYVTPGPGTGACQEEVEQTIPVRLGHVLQALGVEIFCLSGVSVGLATVERGILRVTKLRLWRTAALQNLAFSSQSCLLESFQTNVRTVETAGHVPADFVRGTNQLLQKTSFPKANLSLLRPEVDHSNLSRPVEKTPVHNKNTIVFQELILNHIG